MNKIMNKETTVKTKDGYVMISTVKLMDSNARDIDYMGFGNDDAVGTSHETMVFKCDEDGRLKDFQDIDKNNYYSEEEAEKGHEAMIKKWKTN